MAVTARRALIVDDEKLLGDLLASAVAAAHFDVRVATSFVAARAAIREFDPDVVLLDIDLGAGPSGLHLGHILARTRPDIALVFLTRFDGPQGAIESGLDLPAKAALLKKQRVSDAKLVVDALESVLRERDCVPRHDHPDTLDEYVPASLHGKRFEILRRVATGHSNSSIAAQLGVSTASVERYLVEIYKILKLPTTGETNARVLASIWFNTFERDREAPRE
ncbi:MAG: response regulator [Actinobacteria bacterium]|nr:response regulator [Actinomycetota bacterium]